MSDHDYRVKLHILFKYSTFMIDNERGFPLSRRAALTVTLLGLSGCQTLVSDSDSEPPTVEVEAVVNPDRTISVDATVTDESELNGVFVKWRPTFEWWQESVQWYREAMDHVEENHYRLQLPKTREYPGQHSSYTESDGDVVLVAVEAIDAAGNTFESTPIKCHVASVPIEPGLLWEYPFADATTIYTPGAEVGLANDDWHHHTITNGVNVEVDRQDIEDQVDGYRVSISIETPDNQFVGDLLGKPWSVVGVLYNDENVEVTRLRTRVDGGSTWELDAARAAVSYASLVTVPNSGSVVNAFIEFGKASAEDFVVDDLTEYVSYVTQPEMLDEDNVKIVFDDFSTDHILGENVSSFSRYEMTIDLLAHNTDGESWLTVAPLVRGKNALPKSLSLYARQLDVSLPTALTPRQPCRSSGRRRPVEGEWRMSHGDLANTGYVPNESDIDEPVEELWKFCTSGWALASPVISEGVVYAGAQSGEDGTLFAINAADGTDKWSTVLGKTIFSDPVIDPQTDTLYVGLQDELVSLDSESGEIRWRNTTISVDPDAALVLADGDLIVAGWSGSGQVSRIDSSGDVLWESATASSEVTPTVADGTVYTISRTLDELLALSADTGDELWRRRIAPRGVELSINAITVTGGTVFVGGEFSRSDDENVVHAIDCFVRALDATSGRERWRFSVPGGIRSPMAIDGKTVYAFVAEGDSVPESTPDQGLYAIDATSGREQWRYRTPDTTNSGDAFVATDDRVYFALDGVFALDSDTGRELWRVDHDTRTLGVPVVLVDGVLFVGGPDGIRALTGR